MASATEILKGLKALFEQAPAKFETYKLQDGTEISVSSLEVGGDVTIGGTPAPAGTHVLEDGSSIVVDEAGKITEVIANTGMETTTKVMDATGVVMDAQISALEVGGDVMVNGTPAPMGDYKLEDGTILKVDASGKITEIVPIAAPIDMSAEFSQMKTDFAAHKQSFEDYRTSSDARFAKAEETIGKQADIMTQMMALVEELTKMPQADPPENNRKMFSFSNTEHKNEKLGKFQKAAAKIAEENKNKQ